MLSLRTVVSEQLAQ